MYPGILGAVRRRAGAVSVNLDSAGRRIAPPVLKGSTTTRIVNPATASRTAHSESFLLIFSFTIKKIFVQPNVLQLRPYQF